MEAKVPFFSFEIARTHSMSGRVFWWLCGILGYKMSLPVLASVPWLGTYMIPDTEPNLFQAFFLAMILLSIFFSAFYYGYLATVSRYLPSKPVGRCTKHGLELFALSYAVILQCFWGFTATNLEVFSGFIMEIHTLYQLRCNSPDLGYVDLFLDLVMQVAVYTCGDNKYALVATFVICLLIISYRFYYYSCPETSDLPVGNIQKLGTKEAC